MTREEAIDILQGAIKKPNTKDGYLGQAIDMAIEALEQERSRLAQITQYRNDCEKLMQENEQLKKALEQETYNDAISRQAVIEQTYNWSKDEFLRVTNPFDYLRKRINSLPSVKPQEPFDIETYCKEHFVVMVDKDVWEKAEKALEQEARWIPVSERLPEERDWYLAVFKEKDTGYQLIPRVSEYIGENKWRIIDEEAFVKNYMDILECVAWMPLPEPYKTESEVIE